MTPTKIALVGLPGSGKTTIAPLLAERLGWRSLDLDAEIVAGAGRPVVSIFTQEGEASFRNRELQALETALDDPDPMVIACGGGVIAQEQARRALLERSCVVWLDAPDEVLTSRLSNGAVRPLLSGDPAQAIASLRSAREEAYAHAHLRVETAASATSVADRVAESVRDAIRVDAPSGAYNVHVGPGRVDDIALVVPPKACTVVLIADAAVTSLSQQLMTALRTTRRAVATVEVEGGEALKTWDEAGALLNRLSECNVRRQDCILAVGGGSVGDVSGFIAATYLRGIEWINIPTTLLAMVDSAVGGKTGVNLRSGKNLAGAFWQPRAVLCDPTLVRQLPDRAYRAALSEIVKYAMIGAHGIVDLLEHRLPLLLDRDMDTLCDVIKLCVAFKALTVSKDERDTGVRAILNYGHTVGHAIEAAARFADINHGEAVAVGMRVAGRLSTRMLGCPSDDVAWQDGMLDACGFTTPQALDRRALLDALQRDKKTVRDQVRWVLLKRRGEPLTGQQVVEDVLAAALDDVLRP